MINPEEMLVFELEGGEDWTELNLISFVDDPAIKRPFLAFDSFGGRNPFNFSADPERRIVTGPVLIPELLIPRKIQTKGGTAFINVVFRSEQVPGIYERFMESQAFVNTNLMHAKEPHDPAGCYLLEAFLSDKERGIQAPLGFQDLPDRTIFASYKIKSPSLWEKIQRREIQGYSLEGRFKMKLSEDLEEEAILRQAEALREILKKS